MYMMPRRRKWNACVKIQVCLELLERTPNRKIWFQTAASYLKVGLTPDVFRDLFESSRGHTTSSLSQHMNNLQSIYAKCSLDLKEKLRNYVIFVQPNMHPVSFNTAHKK